MLQHNWLNLSKKASIVKKRRVRVLYVIHPVLT
jgi:hypothetical protein